MDKKDTFCIMPFHHINIKNEGKISTCWRYPDWIGDLIPSVWDWESDEKSVTENAKKTSERIVSEH